MRRRVIAALVLFLSLISTLTLIGALPALAQAPADTAKTSAPADTAQKPAQADTAAAPAPVEFKPPAVLYEKAKVVMEGKAEANGTIKLLYTPEGGTPTLLAVDVLKDHESNDIAKAIHTKLSIAAGDKYKVKVSRNEVKIEKKKSEYPKFSVTVDEIKLAGVSVLVKKG